jgi:hypothetical protein
MATANADILNEDRVVDAYVRAWLGPIPLLTLGLRVVVASVQNNRGAPSSAAGTTRTTLRVPHLASIPKQPDASNSARKGDRRHGRSGNARHGSSSRVKNGLRGAPARLAERARWFVREGEG